MHGNFVASKIVTEKLDATKENMDTFQSNSMAHNRATTIISSDSADQREMQNSLVNKARVESMKHMVMSRAKWVAYL